MDVMKVGLLILCLALSSSPGGYHATTPATFGQLKANSDGTAIVTGMVLENSHSCERDGVCYLRLRVDNTEVGVVYVGAEGEKTPHVRNTDQDWKIEKGDHVDAYGRSQGKNQIEVYSSETFYIRVLNDADQLKANSDGTAVVTGIVLENSHGCEDDGACFLRLRVGNSEVFVDYSWLAGEQLRPVRNTDHEWKIRKGDNVEAYGKSRGKNWIEVISSRTFYVHVLND